MPPAIFWLENSLVPIFSFKKFSAKFLAFNLNLFFYKNNTDITPGKIAEVYEPCDKCHLGSPFGIEFATEAQSSGIESRLGHTFSHLEKLLLIWVIYKSNWLY